MNKLLDFIDSIALDPGNQWFIDKLVAKYAPSFHSDPKDIMRIEKYLGLDYALDTWDSTANYSFVEDETLRNQLISDNREMLRYRFGTRSHRVDFFEVCRYALLQMELMLNYYFDRTCVDIEELKERIQGANPKLETSNWSSVDAIPFFAKLSTLVSEQKITPKLKNTVENIRKARNHQSHRGTDANIVDIEAYQQGLLSQGLRIAEDGDIDWKAAVANKDTNGTYTAIRQSPDYYKFKFSLFLEKQPFDKVIRAVSELSTILSNE
ncbi:MAG: hypothetical protein GX125_03765 [Bacteroidales bacterium]|nr:hypothetical protein [Bacteroidota bacterium]NLN99366.1 hypothetical protein [Bacteroidales bacterium]